MTHVREAGPVKRALIVMVVMAAVALGLAAAAVGRVAAGGADVPTDHPPVVVTPSSTPTQEPSPIGSPGQRSGDDDDDDGFSKVKPKPRPIDDDDDDAGDSDDDAGDD
jgi:hypothetical protein